MHPLKLREVLEDDASNLLEESMGYSQTNGTRELRERIAALYPKATADDILVTNGSSEANFVTLWSLLKKDTEVAIMLPNYMQNWGLARTLQARVKPIWLSEHKGRWALDIHGLKKIVNKKTKLIAVCNPNNPTGSVMAEEEIDAVCSIAKKAGAWILSDEVYQGAELDGEGTPTFWGRYNKVIVTNGLSKAYGLPGLRIGWAVASKELASRLWAFHDYTTIGPSALSDHIARRVLRTNTREKILERTRGILRTNLPVLTEWVKKHHKLLSLIAPKAGAIVYMKCSLGINSTKFAERLLKEKSTLIVPGDHFGMDHYLRIGYGSEQLNLVAGLGRVGELLSTVQSEEGR